MANTKSSEKRARQNIKQGERNNVEKSSARTAVKKARAALAGGDRAAALEALEKATQVLDGAANKGAIHKNNAARRKSRMALAFNKAFGA